jgi:hypothetical protein
LRKLLRKQQADGSWKYSGKQRHRAINYSLIETWKQFRYLIECYGCNREHEPTAKAAEYLFSCQTDAGDIRGFLANQYATYYTGAILSLLIWAGYEEDSRVEKGMQWLLSMRQDDLGWTIPILTHSFDRETQYRLTSEYCDPIEPDRSKAFSHNWTGMVLRAFAAHSRYRDSKAAGIAADHLKSRFFQRDVYTSYRSADYWIKFQYPFWWNNLVAALDTVTRIDPTRDEATQRALDWFVEHQAQDGLWRYSYAKGRRKGNRRTQQVEHWVGLAIGRIFTRCYEP